MPRGVTSKEVKENEGGLVLGFYRIDDNAKLPTKATEGSACFDLYAHGTYDIYSHLIGQSPLVGTGIIADIPEGYHLEVYIRSGVSHNTCLRLANCVGIIDSDYVGEIKLIIDNIGRGVYVIHDGDRIAQCRLVKNEEFDTVELTKPPIRDNVHEGFGSTGK